MTSARIELVDLGPDLGSGLESGLGEIGVEFLGEVPLEPQVRIGGDEGQPIVVSEPDSAAAQSIKTMAQKVAAMVSVQNLTQAPQFETDPALNVLN